MPKRKSTAKTMPRRTRAGYRPKRPSPAPVPAHLPLQASPQASTPDPVTALVVATTVMPRKDTRSFADRLVLPANSLVRKKVMAIVALRLDGKNTDEIADILNVKPATIRQYMFLAGKNGWLSKVAVDPNDRLEHEIAHKVVRNLDEMLDSGDEDRRDAATMKTAEGMLFKRFQVDAQAPPPMAVIGIRIETVAGLPNETREGTTGGNPRFVDGQVI